MRIAFVFPRYYWERKMSPARRHQTEAVMNAPGVESILTGPGWLSWSDGAKGWDNLREFAPDVVDLYKPLGTREALPVRDVADIRDHALTVMRFNEAWWPDWRAQAEAVQAGVKLVVCHHANDLCRFRKVKAIHIPHAACYETFHIRSDFEQRPIQCLLSGVQSADIYPWRETFAGMIKGGMIPGVVRKHPGYRVQPSQWHSQLTEYAKDLKSSVIALCCPSIYRYALAKYVEAAMAGCVLAGEVPHERCEEFREHMIELAPSMEAKDVAEVIRSELADAGRLRQRARLAQEWALRNTMACYAERYLINVKNEAKN